jgi:hypothetical protein
VGPDVNTQVDIISPGNTVRVTSTGLVDFGGAVIGLGAPKLDADGDNETTPSNYPAPTLRKNSPICRIGLNKNWYQGGTDRTFTPSESGKLILRANDFDTRDNSRRWEVTVHVSRPR